MKILNKMMDKKGQGSLEYLLILAAILAIAVVVVVVARSMMAPAKRAGKAAQDKYVCGNSGIELVNYNEQISSGDTIPGDVWSGEITYKGNSIVCDSRSTVSPPDATCTIGEAGNKVDLNVTITYEKVCGIAAAE